MASQLKVLHRLLAIAIVVLVFLASAAPALFAAVNSKPHLSDSLFLEGVIPRFSIEIPAKGIANLREQPREYVRARIRAGDNIYSDVAIRLKGKAGSFQPIDRKPSFTLNFDKFQGGQLFYGLDKIHLNNSVQDPSYLNDIICSELFLGAGLPAPRTTHARVELNGRELGFYVLKEGVDKSFLKRHFQKSKGNLYEADVMMDITDSLEQESNDGKKDQADLKLLAEAVQERDSTKRLNRIERVLDLERFLSFLALEVMTWHWDGYAMHCNNYRVYHNPETDKLVFIPGGMDQMFWKPDGPIIPQMAGLVARKLLEIPEAKERYLQRLAQLVQEVLKEDDLIKRVAEVQKRVRPVLEEIDPKLVVEHDRHVEVVRSRLVQRVQNLRLQLRQLGK